MIDKERASDLLGVNPKTLSVFENIEDPFNAPTRLSGWVCHKPDYRYGSLVIGAVNSLLVPPRVIYGIPKLFYPFSTDPDTGERKYTWGVIDAVEAYTKYDGTNITAYRYYDASGNPYVTFKLRLYPFVRNNRFGDLLDLWRICLEGEPEFSKTCLKMSDDWYPSFEMYGYRNPHMVVYEKPITFSHLCMIGQGEHAGCIEAPYTAEFPHTNPPVKSMTSGKQLTAFYNELRDTAHKVNKGKTEYGTLESEGYVIYAKNSDGLRLFKVKPEEVEDIAWSRGEVIKPHTISATCWNALEHTDDVTLEVVNQLLLEEYSQDAIDRYESRIKKVFWEVRALQKIQERALVLYRQLPKDVQSGGKGGVMRSIMPGFNKKESTAVYNALRISGIFD